LPEEVGQGRPVAQRQTDRQVHARRRREAAQRLQLRDRFRPVPGQGRSFLRPSGQGQEQKGGKNDRSQTRLDIKRSHNRATGPEKLWNVWLNAAA
jgi:hypothetical protein